MRVERKSSIKDNTSRATLPGFFHAPALPTRMDDAKPIRNRLGQFVKGHKPTGGEPRKPGEAIIPHPSNPYIDVKGRFLPGQNGGSRDTLSMLKLAALEAVTPEQVKTVMAELYKLCFDPNEKTKDRLEAMREFLNRTVGKPEQQIQMTQERVTTNVNYDLHKLSDDDLRQLENLLGKTQLPGQGTGPEIVIGE